MFVMKSKLFSLFLLLSLLVTSIAPTLVSATLPSYGIRGAGAEQRNVLPSFEQFSTEDMILQAVGRQVSSRVDFDKLMERCSEKGRSEEAAKEIVNLLEDSGFDYSNVCSSLSGYLNDIDNGADECERLSENGVSCPVDDEKLLSLCKKRLEQEKRFVGSEEDDIIQCQTEFKRVRKEMEVFCRRGGEDQVICPAIYYDPEQDKIARQRCIEQGGTPYTGRCGVTSCDFNIIRPPDEVEGCPPIRPFMKRMCVENGGTPREEFRGACKIFECDFADRPVICPQIAIPRGWKEQCLKEGGIPVDDDASGCPVAVCRRPGMCPPLPAAPSDVLEKRCKDRGMDAFYGVDPAGCKYFTCIGSDKPPDITPCQEVPSTWFAECRAKGGRPEANPDPTRPACKQYQCLGGKVGDYCPTDSENDQRSRDCVSHGGSVYYNYGQGNCKIVACHIGDKPDYCPPEPIYALPATGVSPAASSPFISLEQSCKLSGGTISVQYINSCPKRYCYNDPTKPIACPEDTFTKEQEDKCRANKGQPTTTTFQLKDGQSCSQRYCYFNDLPTPVSCPSEADLSAEEQKCKLGKGTPNRVKAPFSASGSQGTVYCERIECKYGVSCSPLACPAGETPEITAGSSTSAVGSCPIYKCVATQRCQLPKSCPAPSYSQETGRDANNCPIYSCVDIKACAPDPLNCAAGLYSKLDYYDKNGCAVYKCTSTTTPTPGEYCPYNSPVSCSSEQVSQGEDYEHTTTSGAKMKCYRMTCKPLSDYSSMRKCAYGVYGSGNPTSCSAGMALKTNYYTSTDSSGTCLSQSSWCDTDYSVLQECTADKCGTTQCSANEYVETSGYYSHYSSSDSKTCKCPSKICKTKPELCGSATCPSSPTATTSCSSGQVLKTGSSYPWTPPGCTNSISCTTSWCETDYSALQACPTNSTSCTSQTSCQAGYVLKKSTSPYTSYIDNKQCACYSTWCEPDYSSLPFCTSGCYADSICTGGTLRESSSPYTPPGQNCKCVSKYCDYATTITTTPVTTTNATTPGTGTACPTPAASTTSCTGDNIYVSERDAAGCLQYVCKPASGVPSCTTMCTSTYSPSCTAPDVVKNGWTTFTENSATCKCPSSWCERPPEACASSPCPAAPTCPAGQTAQSTGTYTYYPPGCGSPTTNGIQCPSYGACIVSTSATASPSKATGLQVELPTVVPPAVPAPPAQTQILYPGRPVDDICIDSKPSKELFVRRCLSHRRSYGYVSFTVDNIEETCKREVERNKLQLEQACTEGRDPYTECKQRVEKSSSKCSNAFSQCKRLANKDGVFELIKKKYENECKLRTVTDKETLELLSTTTTSTGSNESVDTAQGDLTRERVLLTLAEKETLKEEIKREVFADIAKLLGLRVEQERLEAQRKLAVCKNLEQAASGLSEVCSFVTIEEKKEKCEKKALDLKRESEALCAEANTQQLTAGGVGSIVQLIVSLFTGQPVTPPGLQGKGN